MIFLQPAELAGEFMVNTLIITLMGALMVEYFAHCLGRHNRHQRAVRLLLAIVFIGSTMILYEFFIGRGAIWPNAFYVPGIILIFYLGWRFRRLSGGLGSKSYFRSFIAALMVIFVATVAYLLTQHPLVEFSSIVGQVAAASTLFLYILSFLAASGEAQP